MATRDTAEPIPPGIPIGHVHLKVADLERALAVLLRRLGFELTSARRRRRFSPPAAITTTSA